MIQSRKEHELHERVYKRNQINKSKRLLLVPIRDLFDGAKEVDRESHEASKIYEESQQLMDSFDGKMTEVKLSHCN